MKGFWRVDRTATKRRPITPVLLSLVVLVGLLPLLNAQPAHAAAAAGYSVMGVDPSTGEQGTTTNATTAGTRYDFYANPTDTTTPIAGVRATVRAGTTGADPYFFGTPSVDGANYNFPRTADTAESVNGSVSTGNRVNGNLDIRARVRPDAFDPKGNCAANAVCTTVMAKWNSNSAAAQVWRFGFDRNGALGFHWGDGAVRPYTSDNSGTVFTTTATQWIRVTLQNTNGSNSVVSFYNSSDGVSWSLCQPELRQ